MPLLITLFALILFLELIQPGLGWTLLTALAAFIHWLAVTLPAGAVLVVFGLLPAYLAGWNGAVDQAYQEDIEKAHQNRQRRSKRWLG